MGCSLVFIIWVHAILLTQRKHCVSQQVHNQDKGTCVPNTQWQLKKSCNSLNGEVSLDSFPLDKLIYLHLQTRINSIHALFACIIGSLIHFLRDRIPEN